MAGNSRTNRQLRKEVVKLKGQIKQLQDILHIQDKYWKQKVAAANVPKVKRKWWKIWDTK